MRAERWLTWIGCLTALAGGAFLARLTLPAHAAGRTTHATVSEPTLAPAPVDEAARLHAAPPAMVAPTDLSVDIGAAHDPAGRAYEHGRVITGATANRLILFTFDDGPDPRTTPQLLDQMDRFGIRGIFFVTTNRFQDETPWCRRNAALVGEIARRGHIVGNHSVNHRQLPLLSDRGVNREIELAGEMIEEAMGARPHLYRAPGGARSARVDGMIARAGYTHMLWNLGAGDFMVHTPRAVVDTFFRVLERREREDGHRGGIVLLHDIYPHTVEAFPAMVTALWDRNCEMLESGEELYDIVDDPSLFYAERGDAHPSAEVPLLQLPDDVLARRQARVRARMESYCRARAEADVAP